MRRSLSILPVLPLLWLTSGCGAGGGPRPAAQIAAPDVPAGGWRAVVTVPDRTRLRGWRAAWITALAQAEAGGARSRIAAEGALLQPDRALPGPVPPIGSYRCRVIKLGAQGPGLLEYVAYPAFRCRIAAAGSGQLSFTKIDGSQRPVGMLYPHDGQRMIFLGTMMLGDERRPLAYGRDPERDMAGAVERIGPARWRLLLPSPRWESRFDVMELVPG